MGEADGWLAASRGGLFQLILGWGLGVIAKENHLGIHEDKYNKGLIVLLDCGTRLKVSASGTAKQLSEGALNAACSKILMVEISREVLT